MTTCIAEHELIADQMEIALPMASPDGPCRGDSRTEELTGWLLGLLVDPDLSEMGYVQDARGEVWDVAATANYFADVLSDPAARDEHVAAIADLEAFHQVMTETAVSWWQPTATW